MALAVGKLLLRGLLRKWLNHQARIREDSSNLSWNEKRAPKRSFYVMRRTASNAGSQVLDYSASAAISGRSTSSTIAIGAASPARNPDFKIRMYPPGRS